MNDTQATVERLMSEGERMTLAEAGLYIGQTQNGVRTHPTTLSRWCTAGVKTHDGRRVKLEHIRMGGRIVTTKAAVHRFFAAQTEVPAAPPAAPQNPTQRQRATDAAARHLEAMGA